MFTLLTWYYKSSSKTNIGGEHPLIEETKMQCWEINMILVRIISPKYYIKKIPVMIKVL